MIPRRLSLNALSAIAQVVVSALILFELYRFLLKEIGPAALGVWSLVMASSTVARLAEFGVGGAVSRLAAHDIGAGEFHRAASTIMMCLLTVGVTVGLVCAALYPVLSAGLSKLIADADLLREGQRLLPWALASLWLTAVGQIVLSGLDACLRGDIRAGITLIAAVSQLVAAYIFVPTGGLAALGPVQFIHTVVTLILASLALALQLHQPIRNWFSFEKDRSVAILKHGSGIQVSSLAQLLFDPTVKVLLSIFGDLTYTGFYEAANRAVLQFRSVIVAAFQMLIPYIAHQQGISQWSDRRLAESYQRIQTLLVLIAIPYFSMVTVTLPVIQTYWLGQYNEAFIWIGISCSIGWLANTLITPAYIIFVALGQLRWVVLSHIAIGLANLGIGWIGGWLWGGPGVIAGAVFSLIVGSAVVPIAFHRRFALPLTNFLAQGTGPLFVAGAAGAVLLLHYQMTAGAPSHLSQNYVALLILFGSVNAVLVWRHSVAVKIRQDLGSAFRTHISSLTREKK